MLKIKKTAMALALVGTTASFSAAAQLSGTVTGVDGAPVAGATVSVLDRTAVTGADGRYLIGDLPAVHPLTFRLYREAPPPNPKGRFVFRDVTRETSYVTVAALGPAEGAAGMAAFAVVSLEETAESDLALEAVPDDVSRLCGGCHPSDEQGPRAVGPDDKIPLPTLDADFYRTHRYRDVHPVGMDMAALAKQEKRTSALKKEVALPLRGGRIVTCDSCHTRHLPTPHGRYVIEQFETGSALCVKCHE